jgi:lipopolysaccharide transport system ATP-binding protein
MSLDIAIDLQNISKCYRRYSHPIDRLKELVLPNRAKGTAFWALDNISFQVGRGESLGILGQNGSGKSTLLQIITQTLQPTSGHLKVHGRISALLELGSGFNPDFTGRQNVMINGRILGFSKPEVEAKLDEILAFAEIGDFVDQPVHTYSSGMFVRLAFAAAVVWDPEILIVDEALAVGDVFFQQKCFAHIKALQERGTTILFVSHDTQTVLNLCHRAVVLNRGHLIYQGETSTAVERYFEQYYMSHGDEPPLASPKGDRPLLGSAEAQDSTNRTLHLPFITQFTGKNRYGTAMGIIEGVCVTDAHGQTQPTFVSDEELLISIKLAPHADYLAPLNVGFHLKDRLGQVIIGANLKHMSTSLTPHTPGHPFICQFRFQPQIAPGEYILDAAVAEYVLDAKSIYDWINGAAAFTLVASSAARKQAGLCRPNMTIHIQETNAPLQVVAQTTLPN